MLLPKSIGRSASRKLASRRPATCKETRAINRAMACLSVRVGHARPLDEVGRRGDFATAYTTSSLLGVAKLFSHLLQSAAFSGSDAVA
jgi:hypothetical protein